MRGILLTTSLFISMTTLESLTNQANSGLLPQDEGPSTQLRKFAQRERMSYKGILIDNEYQKPSEETVKKEIASFYKQLQHEIEERTSPLSPLPAFSIAPKKRLTHTIKDRGHNVLQKLEEQRDPGKKTLSLFEDYEEDIEDDDDSNITDTQTSDDEIYGNPDYIVTKAGEIFDERLLEYNNLEPTPLRLKMAIAKMEKKITKIDAEIAALEQKIAQAHQNHSTTPKIEATYKTSLSTSVAEPEEHTPPLSQKEMTFEDMAEREDDGPTLEETKKSDGLIEPKPGRPKLASPSTFSHFLGQFFQFWKSH
jgi:hypothetical protein